MWTYKQDTGELFDAGGAHAATGYSGTPSAKNDPSKQNIPKVGPIPQGMYTIGAPFNSKDHGPYLCASLCGVRL